MEINHLKILRVLVADPNLTRAAERLHMTQSALSKRVQSIEAELGMQLFERRGSRGLSPLPQAVDLAQLGERMILAWETGLKRMHALTIEPEHFFLVGPQLFLRQVVLPWWAVQAKLFPTLQLEVSVSQLSRVSLETIQGHADAGILEHKEELADYVCRPLYTEQWGVVRHPSTKHTDLNKYAWGTYSNLDNPVDTWLVKRQKLSQPSYRMIWQDLTALAIWVSETPGAASVLPEHTVSWLAERKKIVFEPLGPHATTRLYLAYEKKNPNKRFLQALAQIDAKRTIGSPAI